MTYKFISYIANIYWIFERLSRSLGDVHMYGLRLSCRGSSIPICWTERSHSQSCVRARSLFWHNKRRDDTNRWELKHVMVNLRIESKQKTKVKIMMKHRNVYIEFDSFLLSHFSVYTFSFAEHHFGAEQQKKCTERIWTRQQRLLHHQCINFRTWKFFYF